jgi:8-oxo-dGTP pyrophosphatase MutT (NUDIX family)
MALSREVQEELGITKFEPELLAHYVFESDRERELVFAYRTVYDGDIHPSDELDGGKFHTIAEIRSMMYRGVLTPNFEQEFKRLNF